MANQHKPKGKADDSNTERFEDSAMSYIPKELFFEGMMLPVNIYFRVHKENYLTIGRKGEKANFSSFQNFKSANFVIYVKNTDHHQLINYITDLTTKVVQSPVPASVKAKFISGLVTDSVREIEKVGILTTNQAQKVSKIIVEFQKTAPAFNDVLALVAELPPGESKHAMIVCMLSLQIANEMQTTHQAALEKLSLGALLHDIGMKFVPAEILAKPRHTWTMEELAVYEQHPIKAVTMLRDMKDISNDVLQIIAEHHETSQGTGFPKKLREVKLSPLGKIVALADYFSELVFADTGKVYTADEAILHIEDVLGQPYNRQAFAALKNLINKKHLADQKTKAS